jgi:hypothetical protein
VIYWTNQEEHKEPVRKLLERLGEFALYTEAKKCHFGASEVGFIGFIIFHGGLCMESDGIVTREQCPTPETVWDVLVVLVFTKFYPRFIRKYTHINAPISDLLKKAESFRMSKQVKSEWTQNAEFPLLMFK